MRGHFAKRGSSWYYWAELPPGPDGRRRQKSKGGFATKREAMDAYEELRDSVRSRAYVPSSKRSLGAYLVGEWLPAMRATVRSSTLDHYATQVTSYVVPRMGGVGLQRLGSARLNAFYADLLADGRADGTGGLSPKSVRHVHTMLHKALADAVRWGLLAKNPADAADPPKPARTEMKVWEPAQLRTFLDHVANDRLYAAWMLLVTTGMRRGEVIGLRWSDVDLPNRRVSVVQTLTSVDYKVVVSKPKTARGRRAVALDVATAAALKVHGTLQKRERLARGETWIDSGLVFTREDGAPLHPHRFSEWFVKLAVEAGLPRIRLHDLRHSYATAALAVGIPAKIVSERLGHASIAITLDTYSHVLPSMQVDAAEKVAGLILGRA